jgi:two-component system cell cycle response regulator DivK
VAGELILIVEDNEKNMRLVRDVLQFRGYRTIEATNGATGVRLATCESPDLVLLDIQLPDMDGPSAMVRIKDTMSGAAPPIVALTSFAMNGDRERFLGAGFDGYISKPIDVRTFPDRVRAYCDGLRGA